MHYNLRSMIVPMILAITYTAVCTAAEAQDLAWHTTDTTVALQNNGKTVWQFNYGPELRKLHFHPVALLDGTTLTEEAPQDHPWHHALWFSWKLINGVNYWEENRQTGKSAGLTTWKNVKVRTKPDHSAIIEMDLVYNPPEKAVVLTERLSVRITAPGEAGVYKMDWTSTFTAGKEDVLFDRTPLPGEPGGKSFGGYAGLSVRMNNALKDWQAVDSDGQISEQEVRLRFKARAVDFSGTLDGITGGIAIVDHPENLNAPTPWYIILDAKKPMAYFSPAVIQQKPHTLPAGESMTLKYRVVVHPGRFDADKLSSEADAFSSKSR